ncbi:hypothetical protein [Bradyrhizobium sp. USDA 4451]
MKPAGTLSLASGSLSGAAGSGGGATGASLAAASLSGRPIMGEPGGSGCAAGAAPAAGAAAGCCAATESVNAPSMAPASIRLRGANERFFMMISPGWKPLLIAPLMWTGAVRLSVHSLANLSGQLQSETSLTSANAWL